MESKSNRVHRQGFSLRHAIVALACAGALVAAFGCSSSSGSGSCGADSSVKGCVASDGYSCATGDNPPAGLTCSDPTSDGMGNDLYCCYTAISGNSCSSDPSLDMACPDPDSFGYSCTAAGDTPEAVDPSLTCSIDSAGTGEFCCIMSGGGGGGGGCVADTTVTGCVGSDGYSCAPGDPAPDSGNSAIICSAPTLVSGADLYCCYAPPTFTNTCMYDSSLDAACTPDSLGYSCTGTDTPEESDPTLVCSPDQGSGDFCCTTS